MYLINHHSTLIAKEPTDGLKAGIDTSLILGGTAWYVFLSLSVFSPPSFILLVNGPSRSTGVPFGVVSFQGLPLQSRDFGHQKR